MKPMTVLALVVCSQTLATAGASRDVTAHLFDLGQPYDTFYGASASVKGGLYDLIAFNGKVYPSHGSSNNGTPHKMLYYSPTLNGIGGWAQDVDSAGQAYRFNEERTGPAYLIDGRPHLLGYDPFLATPANGAAGSTASKVYRLDTDNIWRAYPITPDAHNKHLGRLGERYFVTYGVSSAVYPGVYSTTSLGTIASPTPASFTLPNGASRTEYQAYFSLGGKLFTTTPKNRFIGNGVWGQTDQPWMIGFDPATGRFDAVFQQATEFLGATHGSLGGLSASPTLYQPMNLASGRLVFGVKDGLFFADSLASAELAMPAPSGHLLKELVPAGEGVLALYQRRTSQGNQALYTSRLFFTSDGAIWTEILSFSQTDIDATQLAYLDGDLYFGGLKYGTTPAPIFHRLPAEFVSIPEPASLALVFAGCLLARRRGR
jgi:hypothetical protein